MEAESALLSSAGMGLVNLFSTLLGLYLIDRTGRSLESLAEGLSQHEHPSFEPASPNDPRQGRPAR